MAWSIPAGVACGGTAIGDRCGGWCDGDGGGGGLTWWMGLLNHAHTVPCR